MCEMGLIKKANTCLKKKKKRKKPFNKLGLELDKELLCQSALAQPASQRAASPGPSGSLRPPPRGGPCVTSPETGGAALQERQGAVAGDPVEGVQHRLAHLLAPWSSPVFSHYSGQDAANPFVALRTHGAL